MRVLGEKSMYKMFWYILRVICILVTIAVTVPQNLNILSMQVQSFGAVKVTLINHNIKWLTAMVITLYQAAVLI
jgi:hypothetical protein